MKVGRCRDVILVDPSAKVARRVLVSMLHVSAPISCGQPPALQCSVYGSWVVIKFQNHLIGKRGSYAFCNI
jgi:hypothetical protein